MASDLASNTTAINGVMQLLRYQSNYPALGTGQQVLAKQAHSLVGDKIPQIFIDYQVIWQFNLFGDYPFKKDIVPSAIFCGVFGLLLIVHSIIFTINTSKGHHFWISLGYVFYCAMKIVGFALRIVWQTDLSNTAVGLTSEVLLIIPSILLISINLILAQRIFTWRHPVGGSRQIFWNVMIGFYVLVLAIVGMTIMAAFVPYIHLLSEANYKKYQKVNQASSVLIVLYTFTAAILLGLAYFFKPTRKDENLYTYQPWWIDSFHPFYFVKKNACIDAAETFMKRNHNHRHAIRVIAATHHHFNMVEGLTNQRGDLNHNTSIWILLISTLVLFVGALLRCITVMQARYQMDSSPACSPIAMYIIWGAAEGILMFIYAIGRVDLRFYRPDRLPAKVRSIITAEQTPQMSEDELSGDETDLQGMSEVSSRSYNSPRPPDYKSEPESHGENHSEFHF